MERFAIKIDKKLKANLYKICRLCGIDNPEMVPILPQNSELANALEAMDVDAEPEMPQKIKLLIGLVVTKDDKMPQTMCSLCVDKINDFYEFREMCYATNTQTRKLLGLKSVKKPVPELKPKAEIKEEVATIPKILGKTFKSLSSSPVKGLKSSTPITVATKCFAKDFRKRKQEEPEEIVGRESRKRKQEEPSLPPPLPKKEQVVPVVSNKRLRLASTPLKEAATKKAKQKNKEELKDVAIKEEIKEEPKDEKPPPTPSATSNAPALAAGSPANHKFKQVCSICPERFATKAKLEAHIRLQHVPKIERFVCTACNETISKSFDIKNHQLWHKLSKTPYICGLCGESIISTYAYARHVREHSIETPPAFLVLDRECPQCHISYATNYLYNTHPCAVKTKRCAGCNRLQRSDAEFVKHSALCSKVYLSYSKHIMPAVEAQEDAVRIKNENDVEAAAEEIARLTGVSLDMAPVVQLTRLSSPLLMAANQCVSIPGLVDSPSTSNKKSTKKGVSKKELKRVDELLKSTLDALVSIKHEPEVHVDTETRPTEGELSDNGEHSSDDNRNMDVGFQDDHESDLEDATKATHSNVSVSDTNVVSVKQEVEETYEALKPGGGLKLKIRKEHGQLNSSIIEQQKSDEKRAEKRKKKKKHKDKVKDKIKSQKELQEEQNSLDSLNTQHNEGNTSNTESPAAVRIKTEPGEEIDTDASAAAYGRLQPEAMIMTSIPMMQLQIACISEGVDFNAPTVVAEDQIRQTSVADGSESNAIASKNTTEHKDVKPNREELDRILQISHVSSGISMETSEEGTELQSCANANEIDLDNQNLEDNGSTNERIEEEENNAEWNAEINAPDDTLAAAQDHNGDEETHNLPSNRKTLKPTKIKTVKNDSNTKTVSVKHRNKACKSTAKQNLQLPTPSDIQITSVQSGVVLNTPSVDAPNDFAPVFIKSEPQNRGYSDERDLVALSPPTSPKMGQNETDESVHVPEKQGELHNEEQAYISTIDFNNITVKQEKDLDISDVQLTANTTRYCKYSLNGIKGSKPARRVQKKIDSLGNVDDLENANEIVNDDLLEYDGIGEEEELEEDASEEEDEDEIETEYEEDPDEEAECEEEEEREYRELEYPPELKKTDVDQDAENSDKTKVTSNYEVQHADAERNNDSSASNAQNERMSVETHQLFQNESQPVALQGFVISNVCSHAPESQNSNNCADTSNLEQSSIQYPLLNSSDNFGEMLPKIHLIESNETNDATNIDLVEDANETSDPNHDSDHVDDQNTSGLVITSVTSESTISGPPLDNFVNQQEISNIDAEDQHDCNADEESVASYVANKLTEGCPTALNESHAIIQDMGQMQHDGAPNEAELDGIAVNSNQTMGIKITSEIAAVESTLVRLNLEQHGGITAESNFVVQQETFSGLEPQRENTDSTILSGTVKDDTPLCTALVSEANDLTCQTSMKPVEDTVNDQSSSDVTCRQYMQEPAFAQIDGPSVCKTLENVSCERQTNPPEFNSETSDALSLDFMNTGSIQASIPCGSHVNKSDQSSNSELTSCQTVEGKIVQSNDSQLEAKPFLELHEKQEESNEMDENDEYLENNYEDDTDTEDDKDADAEQDVDIKKAIIETEVLVDSNLNLEEQQNLQNQQQQEYPTLLACPAALALHPYLEDISSSSNSFLSNTLSQTPPPTQSTSSNSIMQPAPTHHSEETENILNESSDVLSRRPSFNFDNINEIAENNNNANLEREQLQDDQQQRNNIT